MAETSVHYLIRAALRNRLKAASPIGDILPSSYVLLMMPRADEEVDVLPRVCIVPYGKTKWKALDFEGSVNYLYSVEFCLVLANNMDYSSRQDEYQTWLRQVQKIVTPESLTPEVPSVWRIRMREEPVFNRELLNQMYAYQSVVVGYDSQETRQ